ncbi:aminoglycoside phosphotransferase family protein [Nonomuraea wenchangensis]|uniref:Streptomycin 6-kinase/streptomycin 6-kinase n=1 Tax=Nonomuraea wenchangensis TaxID=568860 RepID=A0A1I0L2I2_9ACTN|nr:aminoglycoside phosphotransferase family protein [Nonomuraea wenchangensis]SEU33313.1 streptomycin 6-kinase/streptomycin 6-kinase [Nonomuraea wenchangensis]
MRIVVPEALTASHVKWDGEAGRAWSAGLPALAERYLEEWELRPDGEPGHGVVSLVLPVIRADGTRAALKLQPVNDENATEAVGLRAWDGDGAVRLLADDPATGTLLLERLHAGRSLSALPDDLAALEILTALLARLTGHPAPPGLRRLADIAQDMLDDVAQALTALPREPDRRLLRHCADALAEVVAEPGDRLLHWDLHYDNVLAADREPWLAIDPKPLAGDPGFDLLPALHNRWDDLVATGDVARAVLRRFDLMVAGLGLDPGRAARWTLGRVLQNALWDVEAGADHLDEAHVTLAAALRPRL